MVPVVSSQKKYRNGRSKVKAFGGIGAIKPSIIVVAAAFAPCSSIVVRVTCLIENGYVSGDVNAVIYSSEGIPSDSNAVSRLISIAISNFGSLTGISHGVQDWVIWLNSSDEKLSNNCSADMSSDGSTNTIDALWPLNGSRRALY